MFKQLQLNRNGNSTAESWFNPAHDTSRLFIALLGSALLHLTFIFWGWLHWHSQEPGRQFTLQVSLQQLQKTVPAKSKNMPSRKRDKKDQPQQKKREPTPPEHEKLLTGNGPIIPQLEKNQPSEPKETPEQNNDAEAMPIDTANVPAYPAEAVRQGLESCVLAAVQVSVSGEVSKVVIVHADVANIFDQSVIDAQSTVHYLPARKNGENLPSRVLAVVGFTLEPERHLNCAMKYAGAARAINALPAATEIDMKMVEELIGKQ
jgi:TonB family protein